MTKTIYLIRHGQTDGNATPQFMPRTAPLNELGHQQAKLVAERCKALGADALVSSTMTRAVETAEYIAAATGLKVESSDHFIELLKAESMIELLKASEEGIALHATYIAAYKYGEKYEDAETYSDVQDRITAGLTLLEEHPADNIIVVSHGEFLRSLLIRTLFGDNIGGEAELQAKGAMEHLTNTAISTFTFNDGVWRLKMWNDHAHFAD